MDQITATGLLHEALTPGRRIAVVMPRITEARAAFDSVMRTTFAGLEQRAVVSNISGCEDIDLTNGSTIMFRSARQSLRGMTLDLIYVHSDVPRHTLTPQQWEQWQLETLPTLQTRDGKFILSW